jgi:hypothetical protein
LAVSEEPLPTLVALEVVALELRVLLAQLVVVLVAVAVLDIEARVVAKHRVVGVVALDYLVKGLLALAVQAHSQVLA